MKTLTTIVAVLCFLSGLVWFLQGVCILPGSMMSCRSEWAVYGGLLMLISAGGLAWVYRPKPKPTEPKETNTPK